MIMVRSSICLACIYVCTYACICGWGLLAIQSEPVLYVGPETHSSSPSTTTFDLPSTNPIASGFKRLPNGLYLEKATQLQFFRDRKSGSFIPVKGTQAKSPANTHPSGPSSSGGEIPLAGPMSKKVQDQMKRWEANTTRQTGPPVDPTSFIDLTRMACLLCKRQFKSQAELERHNAHSDLHRKNLELRMTGTEEIPSNHPYRNRAEERRQQAMAQLTEAPSLLTGEPHHYERPQETPQHADLPPSVGASLLRKMGWKEGEGLGKHQSGITQVSPSLLFYTVCSYSGLTIILATYVPVYSPLKPGDMKVPKV